MKAFIGRLLKGAGKKADKSKVLVKASTKKAVKSTVKATAGSTSQTLTASRRALAEKARKAGRTTVQTNPKVGTKAVLKGKPVYWAGKGHGWQSAASYKKVHPPTASQKISNQVASKAKPKALGTPQKPKHAANVAPRRASEPKGTLASKRTAEGKTIAAKGRSGAKARERLAAKRTKPKTDNRFRTEASNLQEDRDVNAKSPRIATSPGTKRPPGSPKRGTNRPQQLTARERQRALLVKNRDIGAKAAAAKTPKSTTDTVRQAGGPIRKGDDNLRTGRGDGGHDPFKSQREGVVSGRKNPQPKGTNPRQTPKGETHLRGREKGNTAVKNFNVEQRIIDMKEKLSAKNTPSLTGAQRQKRIRAETAKIRAQGKSIRAQAEDKVRRRTEAQRNNQSPGKADKSDQHLGKDWRNRLSDDRARQHSEHMTRIRSGKDVRTNGDLVQSPKGKGTQATNRGNTAVGERRGGDGRQKGSYQAQTSTIGIKPSNRNGLKTTDPNTPTQTYKGKEGHLEVEQSSVSRPKPTKIRTTIKPPDKPPAQGITPNGKNAFDTLDSDQRVGGKPSLKQTVALEKERLREQKANQALRERNAGNKPTKTNKNLRPASQRRNASLQGRMDRATKEADTQSQFHSNF